MNGSVLFHVSLSLLLALIGGMACLGTLVWRVSFRPKHTRKSGRSPEQGWHVPVVDSHGIGSSFFHQWDVRFKCVSLFSYCLCIAFLSTPLAACIALLYSFVVLLAGRLPLSRAMKRLRAMIAFLSMFLIVMPLTAICHPGDPLIIIDPFQLVFNLRGFYLALTIVLKAAAIALLMEPLFNTAPLSVTVNGLLRIGVPSQVCQMILMAHRYIFVLLHEAKRMSIGMRVRGFRKRTDLETLRVMGNFVGMLMVRSIDRTERVYQAMLARGYQGSFPVYHHYKSVPLDWYKALAWIVLGVAFIIFDRSGLI